MNSICRTPSLSACYRMFLCSIVLSVFSILTLAQNTISTVAGGGTVNGPATGPNADIPGASAVTKDSSGNTYVAVPAANQVFKIDTAGNLTVYAGLGWPTEYPQHLDGQPATQASLNNPNGVAADSAGNLYIADTTDYLIRQVGSGRNHDMHTIAGSGHQCPMPTSKCGDGGLAKLALMSSPLGVATDAAGNVYIADTKDNLIRVVNMQTTTIIIAGVTIAPRYIATVAGTGDKCTTPTLPCGDTGSSIAAFLNNPQGVAVDATGNIYIADSGDHRIRVVSTTGTINAYVGTGSTCVPKVGCGDGGSAIGANLSGPWQMSLDNAGDLFLTDAPENKIREVNAGTLIITTVAGSGTQGFSGDGGPPLAALLNSPRGVWVDSSGNFVIGDAGNQRLRFVNTQVNSACTAPPCITTLAGGGLGDSAVATNAILAANRGVALDTTGNLYIADTANNRVRKLSSTGVTTVAGTGILGSTGNNGPATAATFNAPDGAATDAAGNIYVADTGNLVIRQINSSTGVIKVVAGTTGKVCTPTTAPCGDGGPATSAMFTLPTTVSLDNLGNFYIADQGGNRIRKVDTSGTITTVAGTGVACTNSMIGMCGDGGPATQAQLNGPFSAVVDGSGDIYIADTNDNRIRKVDAVTKSISAYAFNGTPRSFGPMNVAAIKSTYDTPQNLAIDPRGNLYVSGSAIFYVVVRIDANATGNPIAAVAGTPSDPKFYGYVLGYSGPALGAALNNSGIAIDGSGHLYVADSGNDRVREVLLTPTAIVSPTSLTFPPQSIGTTSPPMTFKLTNTGSDDLLISSTTIDGDFVFAQACSNNNQVAPEQSCTFSVTFTPTIYGKVTGEVIISDNAYQDPTQTVLLTGYGPDFSITANPNSLTVQPGGEGVSTITLTPSGGFNQSVNLTCTGSPGQSQCSIMPSSIILDGIHTATAQLMINVDANVPPGSYALEANGISVINHSASIALTVP